jgi:hypothetical protein
MKIDHLTPKQQTQLIAVRQRFFEAATSTVTDRAKAEAAIAVIVEPALKQYEVHWCTSLQEAASLRASLSDSLWASLWDSGWLAFYIFPATAGLVAYETEQQKRLDAFVAFNESAFALWMLPGHVIALEKPKRVTITDGKLVELDWENSA